MRILLLILLLAGCSSPDLRPSHRVTTFFTQGTAWPIDEDDFLTAWHVVNGAPSVTVNGQVIDQVIRLGGTDLALLRVEGGHGYQPWPVDPRPLVPRERLLLSGWGAGLHWWTEGLAASPDRASLDIAPGDSGGPVRDCYGYVRAVVVARGNFADHHAWLIPMEIILEALPRDSASVPRDRPHIGRPGSENQE